MKDSSTLSPTDVERSDAEDPAKIGTGVTGAQQGQDEEDQHIETPGDFKHLEDSSKNQEEIESSAENPATCDNVGGNHPGLHAGRTSSGRHISGQGQAGDTQSLTGETAYLWLKDIKTRVTSIEGRLVAEDEHSDTESTVYTIENDPPTLEIKPEVKHCNWEVFKNRFLTEDDTVPVIETLLQSTYRSAEHHEEYMKRRPRGPGFLSAQQDLFNESSDLPSSAPGATYDRIRINSAFILAFLSKVARDVTWHNPVPKSLTFLRPFGFLLFFQEQMEEEFLWLEEKFSSQASADETLAPKPQSPQAIVATTTEVPVEENQPVNENLVVNTVSEVEGESRTVQDAPADVVHVDNSERENRDNTASSTPPIENREERDALETLNKIGETGSYEAYIHMKCYVEFVRTKLIPHYKSFDLSDYSNPPQVYYDNLYELFRVGELVFQQDADGQRYANESGDSQMEPNNPRSDAKEPRLWRVIRISTSPQPWVVMDPSMNKNPENVRKFTSGKETSDGPQSIKITAYYVDFDGTSYGSSKPMHFHISFFAGKKAITSLPIYPVRFVKGYEKTLKQLQKRGERFQSIVSQAHPLQSYEGWTLTRDPSGESIEDVNGDLLKFPENIDGSVIVDFGQALLIHPWWKPQFTKYLQEFPEHYFEKDSFALNTWANKKRTKLLDRKWEWVYVDIDAVSPMEYNRFLATDTSIVSRNHKMTDDTQQSAIRELLPEDLVLLPSRIFVYALRERKFYNADIQCLRQNSIVENPFESLEIVEEHRNLITSTVFEHFEKKEVRREALRQGLELSDQDFIRGKGRGLIILLHGAPGVGKTATAEACSYAHNKPLFPITCGDLGIEPQRVEETLSELFRLANLWDCILLFDEADIFLSTREKKDDNLQRNALVSIFLRTLEYYSGVLFLTTNRAGVLDEAVKSRVHISLYYPYLGLRETKVLFQMNIDRLRNIEAERAKVTGKPPMAIEDKRILKFAEDHYIKFEKEFDKRWNGRQIRNAFQVATSLARFQYRRHCEEGNSHRGLFMTSDHFQTVENATKKYDEYRQQLFNKTDAEIAKEREERYHPSGVRGAAPRPAP